MAPFVHPYVDAYGATFQAATFPEAPTGSSKLPGRYESIHVGADDYLADLARYIHLNPVAAEKVATPGSWSYSNYLDVIGRREGTLRDASIVPDLFPTGDAYRGFVEGQDSWVEPELLRRYLLE